MNSEKINIDITKFYERYKNQQPDKKLFKAKIKLLIDEELRKEGC